MNTPLPPGISADALVDLHEQAADWHVRRHQPDWRTQDEQALQRWLGADPLHAEIFRNMARTRATLDLLKAADAEPAAAPAARRSQQASAAPPKPAAGGLRWWRPSLAAAAALVIGVGCFFWWDNTPRYHALHQALDPGQAIALPDGSRLSVNVHSAVEVRYYPRRREAVLTSGEAFFDVAPDASRPFTVASGATRIRVVGTAFNVRAAPPALIVKVGKGRVEVTTGADGLARRQVLLEAGTGLSIDARSGEYQVLHPAPDAVGQWRHGQIQFRRTSLGEVVGEISHYLPEGIELRGRGLTRLPISGYFSVNDPQAFVRLLPAIVDVRVQQDDGGRWVVLPR